ncbi:hypothetical protein Tco_0510717 [Tanacetum coccineum]
MSPNMLGPDLNGKAVNESQYRGMIGPLMNLTASIPNIQFSTALCKTSSKHKESHLISVENFHAKTLVNSKVFFSTPTGGIYGEVGVNTFRNAIGAHYLPHSSEYVAPLSIDIVRPWFKTIRYGEVELPKGLSKRVLFLLDGDKLVAFKSPKPSSNVERVPQGIKPEAKPGHKKHSTSSKQPFVSSKEATKGVTSEARANPQLSSATSTVEVDLGNSAPSDFVPQQQDQTTSVSEGLETVLTQPITRKGVNSFARQIEEETSNTIKLEDLAKLVSHVQPSFKDLDSPEDDPVIIVADSDEDEYKLELEKNKLKAEAALLKAQPSFPNVQQLKELLVKSLKTEFSNILSAHAFSSSLTTELKDLPSKFDELTEEVKRLKKQVHELEIELPRDLKEIPTKLEDFTKTVTSHTSQVLDSASSKAGDQSVPLAGQANTRLAEEEKDANQATISHLFQRRTEKNAEDNPYKGKKVLSLKEAEKESTDSDSDDETHVTGSMKLEEDAKVEAAKQEGGVRKAELVDLLCPKVVKKYYNDKLQYDKYSDKMLNRKAISRITNCDVLTRKGTRMDYIHTTELELCINLDIPPSKQLPLNKLNDLAIKKRKHADDIHDYFKANKRLKLAVQYKDHLPSTVLNEPVLEIFFRRHQVPGLDDHAKTFSSLLLAEIDNRNLNPLKQMRVIEQLRQ